MKTLTFEQFEDLRAQNQDLLLINTLDEEHFAKTKIPGSKNIPQSADNFVQQVAETAGSKERTIVVYCASEQCNSSTEAGKSRAKNWQQLPNARELPYAYEVKVSRPARPRVSSGSIASTMFSLALSSALCPTVQT